MRRFCLLAVFGAGVARSTFYLWRQRYRALGDAGLKRRRPTSHNYPNKTSQAVVGLTAQVD